MNQLKKFRLPYSITKFEINSCSNIRGLPMIADMKIKDLTVFMMNALQSLELPTTITKYSSWIKSKNSFLFSLKSNGRINGMMKFEEKDYCSGFSMYEKTSSDCLFKMNCGFYIYKENNKSSSYVYEHSNYYDYHGTKNRFLPNSKEDTSQKFTPKRFVVIQMK